MTATQDQTEDVATESDTKQRLLDAIDALPEKALAEVASFVEYQRYKHGLEQASTPYEPVALGGLWKGVTITEEDIAEARKEMWGNFGERDF
jgi:hypothetical protein